MNNASGFIVLNVYALIVLVICCIIFFNKKRLHQFEDKIYSRLLICTLAMSIVGIFLGLVIQVSQSNSINIFINKMYLVSIVLWILTLTFYIFNISHEKNDYKKGNKLFNYIGLTIVLLIIIFPIEIVMVDDGTVQAIGMGPYFTYGIFGISIAYDIICTIKNFKKDLIKKYVPIFSLIVIMILLLILMIYDASLNYIINPSLILVTYIMFHTIENPDVKMLDELHKSKEISDNANEEKTLFLFNMTQEIREVTNKISEDANIILDSKDYDEIYDNARDIIARSNTFASATNDILDMSSVNATTIKIYNSKYSVKNIIKQMVNVYGDICKNKELKFRTNIDHDIPDKLYGDGINLKEVLNTILDNSTKYTSSGFVELSVNAIIKNDICRLIFTIEDSGTGIKSEDINKIKVDDKSLSKANKLITMMNGTMIISSDYGVGTKVKVILDQKIGEEEQTEVSKYESVFDNIAILSVDDSESGLKIIEKLLKGTNIKLDLATTGKECLDKIKIGKYDLILLDEDLSQISGTELMLKIKEIRNFKTPVILLTKDNSYEYNEEYIKIGFVDYILKPLNKESLLEKINKYTKKDKN